MTRSSFSRIALVLGSAFAFAQAFAGTSAARGPEWKDWNEDLFKKAKQENKLVILDLEAVWCHWCHVMDENTYSNPGIKATLKEKFIQVRVDQDSRPDLSARYEDYGWPATIIFTPDGKEIVKKSGYLPPEEMKEILATVIKDPSPMKDDADAAGKPAPIGSLPAEQVKKLLALNNESYDDKLGSWQNSHKFLDADFAELSLNQAFDGDAQAKKRLIQTLDAQLQIQDTAWGGFYQYSAGSTWKEPHFEKIMSVQTDNLRIYSQAYLYLKDPKYMMAAQNTASYLQNFLTSPEGAFYTSQDADLVQGKHADDFFSKDDKARRKLGVPKVDKHIYSRENGWAIQALTYLYMASGDPSYLERAEKAADWIKKNRAIKGGGFKHDTKDASGPFLNDTLQMGAAFMRLYAVSGNRAWLEDSVKALDFIEANFKGKKTGYVASKVAAGSLFPSAPSATENTQLSRYANLLNQYSGKPVQLEVVHNTQTFINQPSVAEGIFVASGILLASQEFAKAPIHLTLVGRKDESHAKMLWKYLLKYPLSYQRTEWWDKREGPMPKDDIKYPTLEKPAVFVCSENRCSLPAFDPHAVERQLASLNKQKKGTP